MADWVSLACRKRRTARWHELDVSTETPARPRRAASDRSAADHLIRTDAGAGSDQCGLGEKLG
jgi:hypothetical protein